jgi:hypothetical protein
MAGLSILNYSFVESKLLSLLRVYVTIEYFEKSHVDKRIIPFQFINLNNLSGTIIV